MKERRPYDMVNHEPPDEHAVDRAVQRMRPLKKLRRRIRYATNELMEALGERQHLWLRMEELLGQYRAHREEAYFDLGYEHGAAAGLASALRVLSNSATTAPAFLRARELADTVRDLAVQADLPRALTVAALLETAWSLSLGLPEPVDPTPEERNER